MFAISFRHYVTKYKIYSFRDGKIVRNIRAISIKTVPGMFSGEYLRFISKISSFLLLSEYNPFSYTKHVTHFPEYPLYRILILYGIKRSRPIGGELFVHCTQETGTHFFSPDMRFALFKIALSALCVCATYLRTSYGICAMGYYYSYTSLPTSSDSARIRSHCLIFFALLRFHFAWLLTVIAKTSKYLNPGISVAADRSCLKNSKAAVNAVFFAKALFSLTFR